MSDRRQRSGDARVLPLALNALAEVVPFAVEARRYAMAMGFLEEATPALGTSPHLREQMAGLAAAAKAAEPARSTCSAKRRFLPAT